MMQIFVCRNFIEEAQKAILSNKDFSDVTISEFPARCGRPALSLDEIAGQLSEGKDGISTLIVGRDCLKELKKEQALAKRCTFYELPCFCFEMIAGNTLPSELIKKGSYIVTPGWLRNWRAKIDRMGFDRENFRKFFNETVTRITLFDTFISNDSLKMLEDFSNYADKPHDIIPVGLDYIRLFLKELLMNHRITTETNKAEKSISEYRRFMSEYAMVVDLLEKFSYAVDEKALIQNIMEFFITIFAPGEASFVHFKNNAPFIIYKTGGATEIPDLETVNRIKDINGKAIINESKNGLIVPIAYDDKTLGVLLLENIIFTQHIHHYLNLARSLAPICGLSINNSISYTKLNFLLKEKEILLREVHHRIKNNMASVMGILALHSYTLKDPDAVNALQDAYNRLNSICKLYDKLYRSENFSELPVKTYLECLSEEILLNFPKNKNIELKKEIQDFIISVEISFALGIIVNEILTNTMKYAFEGRTDGQILITAVSDEKSASLTIQDNGVGMPESFDICTAKGFGMSLIKMMTEQIKGKIQIERENGTKFTIEFPLLKSSEPFHIS